MKTIYTENTLLAVMVSTMPALKRGNRAARSLKRQRCYLAQARQALSAKAVKRAQYYLSLWAEERSIWAHLVGRTVATGMEQGK